MDLWLRQLCKSVPDDLKTPADVALFELQHTFPQGLFSLHEEEELGDSWYVDCQPDGSFRLTGGKTGLLYAAYELISRHFAQEPLSGQFSS